MRGRFWTVLVFAVALASPAMAGPPYITDDPEPTDTGHWENYLFVEGTRAGGEFAGPPVGIELNYGPFTDAQLTFSFPLNPDPGTGGLGTVWAPLGVGFKYRFIGEDEDGWRPQVAFFPSVAIPVGTASRNSPVTEFFPIWAQKSFGPWTTFGGGGFTNNPGTGNRDFVTYGMALQRQVRKDLALGVEVFGQTKDSDADHASTAVGLAGIYDFSEEWHLVGSVNTGVVNRQADEYSFNLALKWTI
jgi:hypothetical protein